MANQTPLPVTLSLITPEDFARTWAELSESDRTAALVSIIRERSRFNISLYGEGDSYEGQLNAQRRYKHVDQADGYFSEAVSADVEQSLSLTPEEVFALIMWAFGNMPRVAGWFVVNIWGGQLPTILPPAAVPEPTPEPTPPPAEPQPPATPPTT